MKKLLVIMCVVITMCGCEKKENDIESNIENSVSDVQPETFQPDPYSVNTNRIKHTTVSTEADTTESISVTTATTIQTDISEDTTTESTVSETVQQDSEQQQPDPLGGGAFSYDENGAIEFEQDPAESDDRLLISAGQAMFETACKVQWGLTVGCPYEIDENSTIQNNFGWTYYKITDEHIKSFSDIEEYYYCVFSERYPNEDLKRLYIESDGSVYAFNGKREMNAYYSVSRIKEIQSRTDDEIFFTVENQFEGNDFNPEESYSEEETFSIVLADDKIRVGQFRLPY
ncbi:MAG: hypothetical protein K2L10_07505 [Ruminococcus sp.]|nr:hypothetical protein [Ruminococcus sp.]